MTSSVWINGNSPGSSPLDVEFPTPQHVIVDSMPAGGSGLTDAELRASPVEVDVTNASIAVTGTFFQATQPISAAALPLPSGAATSAAQLPNSHDVTVDNAAGASAVNIQDGGNTITVDGTITANLAAGNNNIGDVDIASLPKASTANLTNVNDTNVSTTLLSANANRLGATIHNDSTEILYVKFGTTASTTSFTVRMVAQAYYEVPFDYTGRIDGIWAADGAGAARITELTA